MNDAADSFAVFFHEKVENIRDNLRINRGVHNRSNKLMVVDRFFMESSDVKDCLESLKPKNVKVTTVYPYVSCTTPVRFY